LKKNPVCCDSRMRPSPLCLALADVVRRRAN
jgi:hypothetical protein